MLSSCALGCRSLVGLAEEDPNTKSSKACLFIFAFRLQTRQGADFSVDGAPLKLHNRASLGNMCTLFLFA